MNKTISISGTQFTAEEIKEFIHAIEDAPANTKVNIRHSAGDRPWESTYYTLSATYKPVSGANNE